MPFCLFIDELAIDKFGKLKIEAVLCFCLWFKQDVRRKAACWFNLGYIEKYLGKYKKKDGNSIGKMKQVEWHAMMSHILNPKMSMVEYLEFRDVVE